MALIHKKRGFTLVELLIVITIIGILAAALIPQITGAQAGARDAARKSAVSGLRPALAQYNNDQGLFPNQPAPTAGCLSTSTGSQTPTASGGLGAYLPSGLTPVDPATTGRNACGVTRSYGYRAVTNANGTATGAYILWADVETVKASNTGNPTIASTLTGATAIGSGQSVVIPDGTSTATGDINTFFVVIGS